METEFKLSATKDRLDNYILETEEWRKKTSEHYQEQLALKDNEIKELRETVELLMKRDESREQDDIMNQLLDFISTDKPKNQNSSPTPQSLPKDKPSTSPVTVQQTSSPSPSPPPSNSTPQSRLKLASDVLETQQSEKKKSTPHLFKVILPDDEGFLSVVYEKNMTLGTILDTVCKKRGWQPDEYRFRHIDARETSPFLPLSLTIGQLNVPSVKAVKVTGTSVQPKYRAVSSVDLSI